jgi:hypothetical protein
MTQNVAYFAQHYSEFLSNELNWEFISDLGIFRARAMESYKISAPTGSKALVFLCGNEPKEVRSLRGFPQNSIWVLLYADETFRPELNFEVITNKAVKGVIRPYWNSSQNYSPNWLIYLIKLFSMCNYLEKIRLIRLALAGYIMVRRQRRIQKLCDRYEKVILKIPLGYTNGFAKSLRQYEEMKCDCVSLIAHALHQNLLEQKRQYSVSFVGQIGNIQRQKFVEMAEKTLSEDNQTSSGSVKIVIRKNFGGTIGSNGATMETFREFIEIGLNSRFGLCPPGNFAGETFRFLELLCLGAVPIEASAIVADPAFFRNGNPISRSINLSIFETQWIFGIDEDVRRGWLRSELELTINTMENLSEALRRD